MSEVQPGDVLEGRYMVEALQNMDAEQLAVELSGPLAPGVLKPVDDPAYVHVIMPVRTPS